MGDMADEFEQVADVLEYLEQHPAVVTQSVNADVDQYDYTSVRFDCRLHHAESDTERGE